MVFKSSLVLLSVLSMLSFSGCSKDDSTSSDGSTGTGDKTALEGTWKDNESTIKFTGHTFDVAYTESEDNVTINLSLHGSFTDEGYKIVQPNDKNTTKMTRRATTCIQNATIIEQNKVNQANATGLCGGHWSINKAKDVTECTDYKDTCIQEKKTTKDIYFIDNKTKLYMGDEEQIGSDGYPDALNTDYSTKQ